MKFIREWCVFISLRVINAKKLLEFCKIPRIKCMAMVSLFLSCHYPQHSLLTNKKTRSVKIRWPSGSGHWTNSRCHWTFLLIWDVDSVWRKKKNTLYWMIKTRMVLAPTNLKGFKSVKIFGNSKQFKWDVKFVKNNKSKINFNDFETNFKMLVRTCQLKSTANDSFEHFHWLLCKEQHHYFNLSISCIVF